MYKRILGLVVFISMMNFSGTAIGQQAQSTLFRYRAPQVSMMPALDGNMMTTSTEWTSLWGVATPTYLISYAASATLASWSAWNDPSKIWVDWRAVWMGDQIYVFVAMTDDALDTVNDPLKDENDSIHWWINGETNVPTPTPVWNWSQDHNYLIDHFPGTDYYLQSSTGMFTSTASGGVFAFGRNTALAPLWQIEASIMKRDMPPTYVAGDFIRYEITYNDVEGASNQFERRLAWNTRSSTPVQPWNRLGKIILSPPATSLQYDVEVEEITDIQLDGSLDEPGYENAMPTILTSAAIPSGQARDWFPWSAFKDAAVTWRAFWKPKASKLYLGFQVYDDFRDSSNVSTNVVNDDGILLLFDRKRDGVFNKADDINVLIHNTGRIFQYTGAEAYDSLYTGKDVKVAIGKLGLSTHNWVAEVEVNLPAGYLVANPDSILRIEIGYNDADSTLAREHQLFWSTVRPGVAPWKDFSNLGRLFLAYKQLPLPVELTSFTATVVENSVTLSWTTASETNNYGFEVQRRTDHTNFQRLGFVAGNGITTSPRSYRFVDRELENGAYYYRLRQIDTDGSFTLSEIVRADVGVVYEYALLPSYPNPFIATTTVGFALKAKGHVTIKIYDLAGKLVATLVDRVSNSGAYQVQWDGTDSNQRLVSNGIYFVAMNVEGSKQTQKIVLIR